MPKMSMKLCGQVSMRGWRRDSEASAKDHLRRFVWKVVWFEILQPHRILDYAEPQNTKNGKKWGVVWHLGQSCNQSSSNRSQYKPRHTRGREKERTRGVLNATSVRVERIRTRTWGWALYDDRPGCVGHRRRGPDEVESLVGHSRRYEWRGWLLMAIRSHRTGLAEWREKQRGGPSVVEFQIPCQPCPRSLALECARLPCGKVWDKGRS